MREKGGDSVEVFTAFCGYIPELKKKVLCCFVTCENFLARYMGPNFFLVCLSEGGTTFLFLISRGDLLFFLRERDPCEAPL